MKAYVIKNKDGYYLVNTFAWSKKLIHAYIDESEKDLGIVLKNCKDCTIVPITICEGDLEEENRELKAELETAEYWNRKYDGLLERVDDIKKAFRHLIKDHIEIINEINGFPLSAEKEEIDEYFDKYIQQAKESEKDERN